MQRAEMEELRHREANNTALQAIGPRKKAKLDNEAITSVVSCRQSFRLIVFLTIIPFLDDHGRTVWNQSKYCTTAAN